MQGLSLLILTVALCCSFGQTFASRQEFNQWMREFGKSYLTKGEEDRRYQIFVSNLERVTTFNAHPDGNSFKMGINQFSDLTHDEFTAMYLNGMTPTADDVARADKYVFSESSTRADIPAVNWAASTNCMSPIQNQYTCGSCYSFAATAAVEFHYCMKTSGGSFFKFSEQQIVDCSKNNKKLCSNCYNYGCDGGWSDHSYDYIKYTGGLMQSAQYPYINAEGPCRYSNLSAVPIRFATKSTTYVTSGQANHNAIVDALKNVGPVTFAYFATDDFNKYKSGVFSSNNGCPSDSMTNHIMVIVGYGTDDKQGDYWLVKNSWGTTWGESGYVRIARSTNSNLCNVMTWVNYPNVIA